MESKILKLPEVQLRTALSRSSIYRLESIGLFPKRVRLGDGHAVGWFQNEIEDYLANRPRAVDAPKVA